MIAIVDYGVGNLFSLASSLKAIGAEIAVSGEKKVLHEAEKSSCRAWVLFATREPNWRKII